MKLISKITAGTLLGFGLAVTLAMITSLAEANTTAEDRTGALAAFAFFGLPPAALGGWMFWNGHRKYHQERNDRLRNSFFKVLKASDGNITPLQFSMETGLDGAEAKVYLDERAKEFNANFNVTSEGNLIYYFEL